MEYYQLYYLEIDGKVVEIWSLLFTYDSGCWSQLFTLHMIKIINQTGFIWAFLCFIPSLVIRKPRLAAASAFLLSNVAISCH